MLLLIRKVFTLGKVMLSFKDDNQQVIMEIVEQGMSGEQNGYESQNSIIRSASTKVKACEAVGEIQENESSLELASKYIMGRNKVRSSNQRAFCAVPGIMNFII